MILCYGEILADLIGREQDGMLSYERHAGGAPFNVACACRRAGGRAGFAGCVGDDIIGRYLHDFAARQGLNIADISVLPNANTTLAFVELSASGERSFCFYRKNTADYRLPAHTLANVSQANIVHIGSLMLSEAEGVAFADKAVDEIKRAGKLFSFDINYRDDIFPDAAAAKKAYAKYAAAADIVKYSEDELQMFTGKSGLNGLQDVARPDRLVCVTLGGKGSAYALGNRVQVVPSIQVQVKDTTGAGDAFYGALLSRLDGKDFTRLSDDELYAVFRFANVAGALATTARGALDSLPTRSQIEQLL